MKNYLLVILAGAILFSTASLFLKSNLNEEKEGLYSIGDEDNPSARADWEYNRRKDPQTGEIPYQIRQKEAAFSATLPTKESFAMYRGNDNTSIQSNTWTMRGPDNIGGRTRAVAFDISAQNVILAGGVHGGVWRSADRGSTWAKTSDPSVMQNVACLAQDIRAEKQNIWYYGTGEMIGTGGRPSRDLTDVGDGIYKSLDGGNSWTVLPSTVKNTPQTLDQPFQFVNNMVVNPANTSQDEVLAAVNGAIMRSTDGGSTWTKVLGGTTSGAPFLTEIAVTSKGVFYAAINNRNYPGNSNSTQIGLWRSTNGVNWVNIKPATFTSTYFNTLIRISGSNENNVYFYSATTSSGGSLILWKYSYVSGDGSGTGGTWTNLSSNLPSGLNAQPGGYCMVLGVKPDNENYIYIGDTDLYRSSNGFTSKNNTKHIGGYANLSASILQPDSMSVLNHHPDQHSLTFSYTDPKVMISGHDGGISLTDDDTKDTVKWLSLNNKYINGQFYAIAIDPVGNDDETVMGGLQDNGTSSVNGFSNKWLKTAGADGMFCAIAKNKTSIYFSYQSGNIYRATVDKDFKILSSANATKVNRSGSYAFVAPFALDPNNTDMMYLPSNRTLYRNKDLTQIPMGILSGSTSMNWSTCFTFTSTQMSGSITAVGISTVPANRVYVGSSNGKVFRLDNAPSDTAKPKDITGSEFPANANINCINVDRSDANKAIVVFSNYSVKSIFYTNDGGTTWTNISGNLEEKLDGTGNGPACNWAEILNYGGQTIYFMGTTVGLFSTTNLNGNSTIWVREGANSVGNVPVDMVVGRETDGFVAIGTHGNGIFTTKLTVTGVEEQTSPQTTLMLHPSFPNPFFDRTTIHFTLATQELVRLQIADITGKTVATLVTENLDAGEHTEVFDGSNLSAGTYFIRLQAGNVVLSQKISLVR